MARMYSRKKGKSGSKKPFKKTPLWVRYKPKEVELLIVKLAKEAKTASQIGLTLRDTYGIPDTKKVAGRKITKILEEKKLLPKLPDDLMALIKKDIAVRKHIERNAKDETAKRGLILAESKIKKLVIYYKRTNKLPEEWKYDPKRVRFYIE